MQLQIRVTVANGTPDAYNLEIEGLIAPTSSYSYQWDLTPGGGTLSDKTEYIPDYSLPPSSGTGTLTLKAMNGSNPTGIESSKDVIIYQDHIARDYDNFGVDKTCQAGIWETPYADITMELWNCHGSTYHMYNGSGTGYNEEEDDFEDFVLTWNKEAEYSNPSASEWSIIESTLDRGDIVAFYGGYYSTQEDLQHSHTCRGSYRQMYGANNSPSIVFSTSSPYITPSWKWYECSSKDYYDGVNAAFQSVAGRNFIKKVIVYGK